VNKFGDLTIILTISFQCLAVFLCFLALFLYFGYFVSEGTQFFAYFCQFKDQVN